jgi:hypothetical protein
MKTPNTSWVFACGAVFGLSLALSVAAVTKTNATPTSDSPTTQWAHLKVLAYPNGGTGFFDPDSGTIYVYDPQMRNCYLVRQLKVLGRPMQ